MRFRGLASLGFLAITVFAGCNGQGEETSAPQEKVGEAEQAVATPCTKDLQGYGAIGGGWYGIRTDGSVWQSDHLGAAAERFDVLGTDNEALADMDGEALGTCVLKTNGDVYCWGLNESGQLGGGFTSPEEVDPVQVVGLPHPAVEVGVSVDYSCARLNDGTVWCWGGNAFGQLGIGTVSGTPELSPVQVTGLGTGVTRLSVGYSHTCAMKGGTVYCWGDNLYGEVGNGDATNTVNTSSPTQVQTGAASLSAGGFYTCTTKPDHTLWCWGDNFWGQLGVNDFSGRYSPTQVTLLGTTVSYVDTAVHATCVVLTNGQVRCWGSQGDGRLGNGVDNGAFCSSGACQPAPIAVSGPLGTTGGADHLRETEGAVCAVMTNGHLSCWGGGGFLDGQPKSTTPVEVDFCGLPTLDSLSPDFGIYSGGTSVTLTGTEFHPGATVTFGSVAGTNVVVSSATSITVTTPDYTFPDTVEVTVTNPDGHRAQRLDAFAFTAPPSVGAVTPAIGTTLGGETVTIQGSSFSPSATVDFGGVAATNVTAVDVNNLTVTTPAHAAGSVDVTVTNPGGLAATLPMAFNYVAPPTVTMLVPASGPTAGGVNIELDGDGFDFSMTASFGGVASPSMVFQDEHTIFATLPEQPEEGVVDVVVTRGDGATFTLPASFTYINEPTGATGSGGASAAGGAGGNDDGGVGSGCYCSVLPESHGDSSGENAGILAAVGLGALVVRRRRFARRIA